MITINPINTAPLRGQTETQQNESTKQGVSPDPIVDQKTKSTQDTVSLSDRSKDIQSMTKHVANLPVVDTQKMEAIKAAIFEGSFYIDADKVADKLLDMEQGIK